MRDKNGNTNETQNITFILELEKGKATNGERAFAHTMVMLNNVVQNKDSTSIIAHKYTQRCIYMLYIKYRFVYYITFHIWENILHIPNRYVFKN